MGSSGAKFRAREAKSRARGAKLKNKHKTEIMLEIIILYEHPKWGAPCFSRHLIRALCLSHLSCLF